MGSQRIDFHEILRVAQQLGATGVYFPRMETLARNNLPQAIQKSRPNASRRKQKRFLEKARDLLDQLLDDMAEANPPSPREAIDETRDWIRDNKRDLSMLVSGGDKDPIPEDEDLEIMVKASNLDSRRVFLLSMDSHFIGYADLLESRWNFQVIDPRQRPTLSQEWRG